jgi:hypothetical protein
VFVLYNNPKAALFAEYISRAFYNHPHSYIGSLYVGAAGGGTGTGGTENTCVVVNRNTGKKNNSSGGSMATKTTIKINEN